MSSSFFHFSSKSLKRSIQIRMTGDLTEWAAAEKLSKCSREIKVSTDVKL